MTCVNMVYVEFNEIKNIYKYIKILCYYLNNKYLKIYK